MSKRIIFDAGDADRAAEVLTRCDDRQRQAFARIGAVIDAARRAAARHRLPVVITLATMDGGARHDFDVEIPPP